MGELYDRTLERHSKLENLGYTVRFVWELDYDAGLRFSTKHPSYKSE
jgi:G:T-mismatch repair DNA endonuclease (very short patch repair protein)